MKFTSRPIILFALCIFSILVSIFFTKLTDFNGSTNLTDNKTDQPEEILNLDENDDSEIIESTIESNPWEGVSTTTGSNGMINFVHTKWGISFQYPSVCEASFGEMMGEFGLSGGDDCNFSVLEYDLEEDYGYYFLSTMTGIFPKKVEDILESDLESTELTEFHGFKAVKGIFYNELIDYKGQYLYVETNGKIFEIEYTISNAEKVFSQERAQKILNSIKFIE